MGHLNNQITGVIPDSLCSKANRVAADMHVACSCCVNNMTVDDCNDCDIECAVVELTLSTDRLGHDTSFTLINTLTDAVLWSVGGPYLSSFTTTNYTAKVCPTQCYHFELLDGGGDGICCAIGLGEYSLYYQGQIVSSGGMF